MFKTKKIKVLIIEPQKNPYCKKVVNELKPLQDIVGGYLESITLNNHIAILCNEDGKSLNLRKNSSIFYQPIGKIDFIGTYLFVAHDEKGEFISLTDKDIAFCLSCLLP